MFYSANSKLELATYDINKNRFVTQAFRGPSPPLVPWVPSPTFPASTMPMHTCTRWTILSQQQQHTDSLGTRQICDLMCYLLWPMRLAPLLNRQIPADVLRVQTIEAWVLLRHQPWLPLICHRFHLLWLVVCLSNWPGAKSRSPSLPWRTRTNKPD